ncbi:MAG: TIGR03790 family protein [Chitinophagaceae bacterium]|nr:TIGR03790 family protein [Chitinophagaceae bacterium]
MNLRKNSILAFLILIGQTVFSQLSNRVLVVKNINSAASITIADDYMLRRGVTKQVIINCQNSQNNAGLETISYANFVSQVQTPLLNYLGSHPEIDFIVLTKGIPIRISNVPGKTYGGICALDSYIAGFGYEASPTTSTVHISDLNYGISYNGDAYANKYWLSSTSFSHASFGGYLVTRLDGYTVADAVALTTRSMQAEADLAAGIPSTGRILLDADPAYGFPNRANQPYTIIPNGYVPGQPLAITVESAYGDCNSDMIKTYNELTARSIPVQYDSSIIYIGNISGLKGYYGWGSNDTHFNQSLYNSLGFVPGAVAETIVSTGARSFLPTTGGQSMIADLIAQGVTGIKGYSDEPLVQGVASPGVLFDRYTRGWTLAESFYAASRLVSWMDIVIGDPICRAYINPQVVNPVPGKSKFSISPNPASGFITIQFNDTIKQALEIYNCQGQKIKAGSVLRNEQVNISALPGGLYFVRLPDYFNQVQKFIKH